MSSTPPPTPPDRRRRWKPAVVAAALAVAGGGVTYWRAAGDGRAEALAACRAGRFAEVEPGLKAALARRPDDVEVLDCLARGHLAAGNGPEAEADLSRLIDLRPQSGEYLRLRMQLYRDRKDREKAYADARRLLELEPADAQLRRTAMGQAFSVGAFAEAEEHCRALLADAPGDRGLRALLAQIRRARGDDAGAAEVLDDLIREDPRNYAALQARGTLYDEVGQPDKAVPLLRRVFEEDPSRRRTAGYQLALALGKAGQRAEADRVLAEVQRLQDVELSGEAIKSQPDNPDLRLRLAESLVRDGHPADGRAMLEQLVADHPRYAPGHLALADLYDEQGRADLAAEHRRRAGRSP